MGPGDEVLVPDFTFPATANAVRHCGPHPVLLDVDPETLTLSVPRSRVETDDEHPLGRRAVAAVESAQFRLGPPADGLDERFRRVDECLWQIRNRGGQGVFLRPVSLGAVRHEEEAVFPRRAYWDRFAVGTSGIAIHFENAPSLAGYRCPDGIHLDDRDAERFSRDIAREREKRRALPWQASGERVGRARG